KRAVTAQKKRSPNGLRFLLLKAKSELGLQPHPAGVAIRTIVGYLAVEVFLINFYVVTVVLRKRRQLFGHPEIHTGTDKRIYFIVGFAFAKGIHIKGGGERAGFGVRSEERRVG